ncbi:MAG: VanZ family protein [Thermoanaerobacteraceae bacterium]|nr:VanZ family protein [Thermoanaerobacteraceae bacterium]
MGLVGVTIFPIPIGVPYYGDYFHVNFIPFKSIQGSLNHSWYMVPLRNIGGNLVLLAPFGFLLPLIWKSANTLRKVVATGFLLSLSIELLQLVIPGRAADVDDLILNTFGLLFGFLAFKLFDQLLRLITKEKRLSETR